MATDEEPERASEGPPQGGADTPAGAGGKPLDLDPMAIAVARVQKQVQQADLARAAMAGRLIQAAMPSISWRSDMITRTLQIAADANSRIVSQASQAVEAIRTALPALADLVELMRTALPPNWDEGIDLDAAEKILNEEGIPLVFVPSQPILARLLAASDRAERIAILVEEEEQVLTDCAEVLGGVTHSSLAGQAPLAKAAVRAIQDGHRAAGQALAVVVVETLVQHILGMTYKQAQRDLVLDFDELAYIDLRVKAAFAPVPLFYTSWWPSSGTPPPPALSRHVSVHLADSAHYTPEHALVAAMLVASVTKALDESQHEEHPEPGP